MLEMLEVMEVIGVTLLFFLNLVLWRAVALVLMSLSLSRWDPLAPPLSLMLAGTFMRSTIVGSIYIDHPLVEPSTLGVEAKVLVPPLVLEAKEEVAV